jgi:TonB family protein
MGKIVKYCAACEESFSDKFSFCPNCAAGLTAYEMSPIPESVSSQSIPTETVASSSEPEVVVSQSPINETMGEPTLPTFLAQQEVVETKPEPVVAPVSEIKAEPVVEIEAPVVTQPAVAVTPPKVAPRPESKPVVAAPPVYQRAVASTAAKPGSSRGASSAKVGNDGFYSITLVENRDSGTRNMLLLGAFVIVMGTAFFGLIASIYNADAFVSALDDDLNSIVYVSDDTPPEVEPELPEPKNKDKGGGGGGGGDNDPNPVSKGVLASQSEKPMIPPSTKMDQVTNPELVLKPETQGNRKEQPTTEKYGDPNSKFDIASDGPGSGGGQGSGQGRGQGSGRGTGAGSGIGSGNGSGNGNGNGDGTGDGDNGPDDAPVIKRPVGPTVGIAITNKPRANYTDAARQNQVQGTVTLRVTFNANGTIGGISPVSGLPNGLTEQAIAAARNIRFTPAMKNGVAVTVTKQVQYSFTLY